MTNPDSNSSSRSIQRRYDLDALRAVAMLLGIALHGAISFIPGASIWAVRDTQTSSIFGVATGLVHGFRMPLFFILSGFFTAMLWRKRGLRSLLIQRARRILLPLVIALLTIIPLTWAVGAYVAPKPNPGAANSDPGLPWLEAAKGNREAVDAWLSEGGNVDGRTDDGATLLHISILFGHDEMTEALLAAGADLDARNQRGERCFDMLAVPWGITAYVAGIISVDAKQTDVVEGRRAIATRLDERSRSSEATDLLRAAAMHPDAGPIQPEDQVTAIARGLTEFPLMAHLWFLWFLCWLVVGFAIVVSIAGAIGLPKVPRWVSVSRFNYLWLIPITAIAQSWMREGANTFGPDTSAGLLPMPHVLAYYAIFFALGALYFDAGDEAGSVGNRWWLTIPFAMLVLFPVGLGATSRDMEFSRVIHVFCQASYAWLMSLGMMGMFKYLMPREGKVMRYLSDASYWMYLAHIPLIILVQYWVRDVTAPAILKFIFVCMATSATLLASYHIFVRYTPIGTLLNGKRTPTSSQNPNAQPLMESS